MCERVCEGDLCSFLFFNDTDAYHVLIEVVPFSGGGSSLILFSGRSCLFVVMLDSPGGHDGDGDGDGG